MRDDNIRKSYRREINLQTKIVKSKVKYNRQKSKKETTNEIH